MKINSFLNGILGIKLYLHKCINQTFERRYIFRYTDALSANWERRKATQEKWNFTCNCNRCKDITEFNTFTSGIVCCQCDKGTLLIDVQDQVCFI